MDFLRRIIRVAPFPLVTRAVVTAPITEQSSMFMRLTASVALFLATHCIAQDTVAEPFRAGVDYHQIEPAQPTSSGDKIEVIEVFGYSCGGCAAFQPHVSTWKGKLADDVSFAYVPAVFGGIWENFARAYFTAETMGILDKTHEEMFKAVHIEKNIRSADEIPAFYARHGISAEDFAATMNSFAVNAKVSRAKQQVPRYGVSSTPTMIVAGKYRIEVGSNQTNTYSRILEIVDFLVAKERAAGK